MVYSNQPGCFVKLFRAPPNSHKPSINRYWRGIRRVRPPRWGRKTRLRVSLNYVLAHIIQTNLFFPAVIDPRFPGNADTKMPVQQERCLGTKGLVS
jgi:hypothetical protein